MFNEVVWCIGSREFRSDLEEDDSIYFEEDIGTHEYPETESTESITMKDLFLYLHKKSTYDAKIKKELKADLIKQHKTKTKGLNTQIKNLRNKLKEQTENCETANIMNKNLLGDINSLKKSIKLIQNE